MENKKMNKENKINPIKIKEWVKKDSIVIEALREYNRGEEIIDRTIELTLRKILRDLKK